MMGRDEYRAALGRLCLTQEEVGLLLGAARRTARTWASGETPVPGPVEMHIRMRQHLPELLDVFRRLASERDEKNAKRAA